MRIVIVGGGIIALASAYNIAKLHGEEIIVLEKGYIPCGSSTRLASRFRVHFWSEENTRFAIESRKLMLKLQSSFNLNPLTEVCGYLWILTREDELKAFKEKNKLWERLGVPGRFLSPEDVKDSYPYINVEDVIGAFFGPQNGCYHHDYVSYGYLMAGRKLGVRFFEGSKVTGIVVENNKVRGVNTMNGQVDADIVLLAAGAWTDELLSSIGIVLPTDAVRKEMAITESYKHFIDPLVVDFSFGAYYGQTLKGEILGSISVPVDHGLIPLNTSFKFVAKWAYHLYKRIPITMNARIMRTWSGYYSTSIDSSHIMGRDPDWPKGLYVAYADSGHGFMFAPLIGKLIARNIVYDEIDNLMKPFLPTRFKEGRLIEEKLVIG